MADRPFRAANKPTYDHTKNKTQMVTAAKAAITQMSSVATPLLTGVNRSSAVCVAMWGTGSSYGRFHLASAATGYEYFPQKVRRKRRLAAARCKIDNRSQTR